MNAGRRSTGILLAIAVLTTAAGCRDRVGPTGPSMDPPVNPSAAISDGAHAGNTDVFFLPPMVGNPSAQPGYGDAFQPGLPVSFKIIDRTAGSVKREFAPSAVSTSDDHYQVNWDTKADILDPAHIYRIETWIGSTLIAFADVDVVSSGNMLKNVNTNLEIPLLDGRTLPIKVRVEKGWNCNNNSSCAAGVITNTPPAGQTYTILTTGDAENSLAFPANWFDPAAAPNGVLVSLEDVTEELSNEQGCSLGKTTMVAHERCIRVRTDPVVTVTNTVIAIACLTDDSDPQTLLLKISEGEGGTVKFLRNVTPPVLCPEHIGANPYSNPVAHYAYAALQRVGRMISPRTAYALDLGVGGGFDSGDGFSIITSGVPLSLSILDGNNQSGPTGTVAEDPMRVALSALHRGGATHPVGRNGAAVTCSVTRGTGRFGEATSVPAVQNGEEDGDGEYRCPAFTFGDGVNEVTVSVDHVDDVVRVGTETFTGRVTFTLRGVTDVVGGGDLVVIGDANMLGSAPARFFQNLVNYTTDGARSEGTRVLADCGRSRAGFCDVGASFTAAVAAVGFSVTVNTTPALPVPIPADVKVVILESPVADYTTSEINALKVFASEGGRLVVTVEYAANYPGIPNALSLFSSLGAPVTSISGQFACPGSPTQLQIVEHPIMSGVAQLSASCGAAFGFDGEVQVLFTYPSNNVMGAVMPVDTTPIPSN